MPCCTEKRIMKMHVSAGPTTKTFPGDSSPFSATLVGNTTWLGSDGGPVGVWYETALGASGLAVAQACLAKMDDLMAYNDAIFGVKGKSGNVIVCSTPFQGATDGSGGAFHYGCAFNADGAGSDWYECMGPADLVFGLVMAEVCESYMGLQGKKIDCGGSGGEGLSRFLAEIVSGGPGGALAAFASGSAWDGTDWISRDQGTDGDYPSIGCAILYCWWMTHLGYTVAQIVHAGEPDGTLASNYAALTGKPKAQAFADFKAAVAAAGGPTGDNPWNAPTPPWQGVPVPTPVPVPVPTPVPVPAPTTDCVHRMNLWFARVVLANARHHQTVAWVKAVQKAMDEEAAKFPNG